MSLPALLAVLLGFSLTTYASSPAPISAPGSSTCSGSGRSGRPRQRDRDAIADTIGPLWEANHVWLVFSIILLFSAFPHGLRRTRHGLLAPLTIALRRDRRAQRRPWRARKHGDLSA